MIILSAPVGFFVNSLKAQQKVLFSQQLLDNISYSMEYVSRALRMAQKDVDGTCITSKMNYELTTKDGCNSCIGIRFLNYHNVCQEFYWDNSTTTRRLIEVKGGNTLPLTSDDLDVVTFKIGPTDSWYQSDDTQPKVTLYLEVRGVKSKRVEVQPQIKIETTISQRNLDVQI